MNYYVEQANKLLVKIKLAIPTLPKVERRAAEYILENINRIGNLRLTEFAEESQCSQASIIRLCRKLNTEGFAHLKSILKYYTDDSEIAASDIPHGISEEDSIKDILKKVFEGNIQTLNDTLALVSDEYDRALEALMKARHISFFAIGDAVVPCIFAQNKLLKLGIPCSVSNDPDMQLINASILGPEDAAVAISYSGRSKTVVEAMRLCKESGAVTIGITKAERSPLTKYCDVVLLTATNDYSEGKDIIAQRIAEHAIMEALYMGILVKGDYMKPLRKVVKSLSFNKT